MSLSDKFSLGLNTALIGMGIVFIVLVALWLIIALEHRIIDYLSNVLGGQKCQSVEKIVDDSPIEKSGYTFGESVIEAVDDDETVAVILAVVSDYTEIPIDKLKIISVRAV